MPPEWERHMTQWRWMHSLFAYLGPPCHVLWRILPPFIAVMIVRPMLAACATAVACA